MCICVHMCVRLALFLLQRELLEAFPTLKYLWHIQAENRNQIFSFPAQFAHKMLTLVFHPQSLSSLFSSSGSTSASYSCYQETSIKNTLFSSSCVSAMLVQLYNEQMRCQQHFWKGTGKKKTVWICFRNLFMFLSQIQGTLKGYTLFLRLTWLHVLTPIHTE